MPNLIESIYLRNTEREFFSTLFTEAGFKHVALNELKNRYHNSWAAPPWFAVTTELGFFVIGCRKRVIDIQWSDISLPKGHFDDLGDTTHGYDHVHAWDRVKAVEYLTRIRENATWNDPDALNWARTEGEFQLVSDDAKVSLQYMANAYGAAEFNKMKKESEY
jgi:hypothetical protein